MSVQLYLASRSPRRAEFLSVLGLRHAVIAADVPEQPQPGSDPVRSAGPQITQVLVTPYASARDLLVALCPVAYGCGDGAQCRLADRLDVEIDALPPETLVRFETEDLVNWHPAVFGRHSGCDRVTHQGMIFDDDESHNQNCRQIDRGSSERGTAMKSQSHAGARAQRPIRQTATCHLCPPHRTPAYLNLSILQASRPALRAMASRP